VRGDEPDAEEEEGQQDEEAHDEVRDKQSASQPIRREGEEGVHRSISLLR